MEIKKGNASPVNRSIFSCIYGDPGLKKTSFAGTAEAPLLLDFDQRAHRAYEAHKFDRIDAKSFDDIGEAAAKYKGKYKTLIIDTAGRALDVKSREIVKLSKSSPAMKAHNPFGGLSLPGYGILKNAFLEATQEIRASEMHCVFVCHGKRTKEGDQTIWEPDVVGSSSDEIYKVCDLMGLIAPINGRTAIRLNPDERWQAKNPLGLTTVLIDKKGEPGWEITLKDLIDQCVVAVTKTNTPVDPPAIIAEINACVDIETANRLVGRILEMPDGVEKDMASGAFKNMRTKNGFKYNTSKGVYIQ